MIEAASHTLNLQAFVKEVAHEHRILQIRILILRLSLSITQLTLVIRPYQIQLAPFRKEARMIPTTMEILYFGVFACVELLPFTFLQIHVVLILNETAPEIQSRCYSTMLLGGTVLGGSR